MVKDTKGFINMDEKGRAVRDVIMTLAKGYTSKVRGGSFIINNI